MIGNIIYKLSNVGDCDEDCRVSFVRPTSPQLDTLERVLIHITLRCDRRSGFCEFQITMGCYRKRRGGMSRSWQWNIAYRTEAGCLPLRPKKSKILPPVPPEDSGLRCLVLRPLQQHLRSPQIPINKTKTLFRNPQNLLWLQRTPHYHPKKPEICYLLYRILPIVFSCHREVHFPTPRSTTSSPISRSSSWSSSANCTLLVIAKSQLCR